MLHSTYLIFIEIPHKNSNDPTSCFFSKGISIWDVDSVIFIALVLICSEAQGEVYQVTYTCLSSPKGASLIVVLCQGVEEPGATYTSSQQIRAPSIKMVTLTERTHVPTWGLAKILEKYL